ncbi:MAG: hypothetical protein ABFS56_03190 [Pseudomonadota bacterium]
MIAIIAGKFDSIRFCQENKGLKLHAYVFMLNHIHFIVASNDVAGFVRDGFKKFTSKQFRLNLERTEPQVVLDEDECSPKNRKLGFLLAKN